MITDDDQSRALEHLFKKATAEVKAFHKPEFLKKIAVEKDGILYSKSRILDGQRIKVAPGFEDLDFLKSFKPFQSGFNLVCPVLDRFSPVSFAIAFYIHNTRCTSTGATRAATGSAWTLSTSWRV